MTAFRRLLCGFAALAAAMLPMGAQGNDSTAILEAGELRLTANPDITLEREDLYLSTAEVRVHYCFRNTSNRDIITLVAFPLPEITIGDDANYSVDARDPVNVIGFEVSVNGRRVEPNIELRASRFGVDRTDILKRHGVPVLPFASDFYPRLEKVRGAARAELERTGLVDWHSSFGANNVPLPNPHWTAHAVFYWEQTFPARTVTEVAHRYRPVPGESFYGDYVLQDRALIDSYCMDRSFLAAAKRLIAKTPNGIMRELHYVLTTAGNWRGSIGEFSLTIDKGKPGNLVSLCIDGIRKTGPTTFEVHARDFVPERDLKILLLERPAAAP
jgi:hypothetical protein